MREAHEFNIARNDLTRDAFRTKLLLKMHDALDRMDQRHKEFRGNTAKEVWYETAPSDAFERYARAAQILAREYRIEIGEPGDRSEVNDAVRSDHERAALRAAIERELAARGEPTGSVADGASPDPLR